MAFDGEALTFSKRLCTLFSIQSTDERKTMMNHDDRWIVNHVGKQHPSGER